MPLLINRQLVSDDRWQLQTTESVDLAANGDLIVPLSAWQQFHQSGEQRVGRLAALVNGDDSLDDILGLLNSSPELIAVEFPVLRDGRGFSIARALRAAGFGGQLRAVGAVSRDKLGYLERCGFDAVELPAEHFEISCLDAYSEISVRYQGSADDARPIYRQ